MGSDEDPCVGLLQEEVPFDLPRGVDGRGGRSGMAPEEPVQTTRAESLHVRLSLNELSLRRLHRLHPRLSQAPRTELKTN